jgi:hypothetical protein
VLLTITFNQFMATIRAESSGTRLKIGQFPSLITGIWAKSLKWRRKNERHLMPIIHPGKLRVVEVLSSRVGLN